VDQDAPSLSNTMLESIPITPNCEEVRR